MLQQTAPPTVPGYRLDAVIGVGGSSTVWSGRDAMDAAVAVKVPHEQPDTVALMQIDLERHVLMAVRHDHLVALRDVVALGDGRVALVSDLVTGAPLTGIVRARGHLRAGEVVTVVTPLCEAVATLHAAGGTHGDISAANVVLTAEGKPVLLDLGTARLAGAGAGAVFATPGFTAPEVRGGDVPGEAADVFALGAVMWFCATGNGAPDTDIRLDPETIRSHVGAALAEVVGACIDPDPARRPGAAELARLLYEAAEPEPVEVVVGADEASALTHRLRADAASDTAPPADERMTRPVRRHVVSAACAVAVLAAAGATWGLTRASSEPAPTTRSTATSPGRGASGAATTATSPAPLPASAPIAAKAAERADTALLLDPAAPRARAAHLMQVLSDRRATSLVAQDAALLAGVHRAGSASMRLDAELVDALRTAGVRWESLRLDVAAATFVDGGPARATVRARVDWTSYTVVGVDGHRSVRPPERGEVLDFVLVRTASGWRMETISEPGAT